MSTAEMPIFSKTFDFLSWLLPATNHFPRAHRHSFTQRVLHAAFDFRERLEEANLRRGAARRDSLARADECLAFIRMYLRLAAKWGWLSSGQYEHVALMVTEMGRLLGGWRSLILAAFRRRGTGQITTVPLPVPRFGVGAGRFYTGHGPSPVYADSCADQANPPSAPHVGRGSNA